MVSEPHANPPAAPTTAIPAEGPIFPAWPDPRSSPEFLCTMPGTSAPAPAPGPADSTLCSSMKPASVIRADPAGSPGPGIDTRSSPPSPESMGDPLPWPGSGDGPESCCPDVPLPVSPEISPGCGMPDPIPPFASFPGAVPSAMAPAGAPGSAEEVEEPEPEGPDDSGPAAPEGPTASDPAVPLPAAEPCADAAPGTQRISTAVHTSSRKSRDRCMSARVYQKG